MTGHHPGKLRLPTLLLLSLLPSSLLTLSLGGLSACSSDLSAEPSQDPNRFVVQRADLPITVRENAELQALRETIVRSQVEGQATIIAIIAEGTHVQEGEELVRLDVSDLEEKEATQAISVAKAEAALTQARKEKEILEKELTTKRNTAKSNLRITEMELEKLLGRKTTSSSSEGKNGDMIKKLHALVQTPPAEPVTVAEADSGPGTADATPALVAQVDPRSYRGLVDKVTELLLVPGVDGADSHTDRDMGDMANQILQQADQIRLAMADLKVKEDTFAHSRRLEHKRFITRNELEKDQLAYQSQVSKVTLAWNDLDLLINYTLAKERIKLMQDHDNAMLEVERVDGSNDSARTKADSDLASREMEYKLAKERLDNLRRQIQNGVITAPTPGTVVYARIDRNRGGGEAVREGVQVRDRQELIILPDTTKMRCVVKVQEAQVDKVTRGQPALVTAEAFGSETFTGRVTNVAPVADSNSGWMTSDRKVYTTIVELDSDNPDGRLRSRMAANVTIMVETIKDTLPVPLQAVFRDRSVNYVWRQGRNGPKEQPVRVGRQNSERVEILDGVADGDVLLLTAPAGVQEPKFEQPVVPTPLPMAVPTKNDGAAAAPNAEGAAPGGDSPRGGRGNRGNRGGGMGKKLTEMSAEELAAWKETGLGRYEEMLEGGRATLTEEQVQKFETDLAALRSALQAGNLEGAEAARTAITATMRAMMGGRGRGRGGNGPGGNGPGGNGPGGSNPGGNAPGGDGQAGTNGGGNGRRDRGNR